MHFEMVDSAKIKNLDNSILFFVHVKAAYA